MFFERTSDASGLWPLVAARRVGSARGDCGLLLPQPLGVGRAWPIALASGALDMTANVLYSSPPARLLTIVAVVTALYPVSTVALAFGLDGDAVSRSQGVGMVLALAALAMVSLA